MSDELARHKTAMKIVRHLGEAIRGDWGTIDGRSTKLTTDGLCEYAATGQDASRYEYAMSKGQLFADDLCWRSGRGHWMDHCYEDECSDELWASRAGQ